MIAALWNRLLLVSVLVFGLLGCEVNEEKIELWKGTQNGPKKLAGTLIDPEIELRPACVMREANSACRILPGTVRSYPKEGGFASRGELERALCVLDGDIVSVHA